MKVCHGKIRNTLSHLLEVPLSIFNIQLLILPAFPLISRTIHAHNIHQFTTRTPYIFAFLSQSLTLPRPSKDGSRTGQRVSISMKNKRIVEGNRSHKFVILSFFSPSSRREFCRSRVFTAKRKRRCLALKS